MISFRPATPADRDFIVTNWESSYQDANTAGIIPMALWADTMRPIVEHYLDRDGTKTIVAFNPDAEPGIADLHGFICGEPEERLPMVHYVYVEQSMRRFGIARRLFAALGVDPLKPFTYLCSTPILAPSRELVRKVPLAKWKPIRARYSREARR
jgi:GNAT superfamily N-acetyltransferase